jgi:hypothetical protein
MRWILYGVCAILLVNGVIILVNWLGWMQRTDVRDDPKVRNLILFALPGGVLLVAAGMLGYIHDSWLFAVSGLVLAWAVKNLEARYTRRTFGSSRGTEP